MKFIAKCDYTLGIKKPVMKPEVSQNGVTSYRVEVPAVRAVFEQRTLSHAEIESARAQILNNGGPYAFGVFRENGAAWRYTARRAASSSSFSFSFSRRSR